MKKKWGVIDQDAARCRITLVAFVYILAIILRVKHYQYKGLLNVMLTCHISWLFKLHSHKTPLIGFMLWFRPNRINGRLPSIYWNRATTYHIPYNFSLVFCSTTPLLIDDSDTILLHNWPKSFRSFYYSNELVSNYIGNESMSRYIPIKEHCYEIRSCCVMCHW